MELDEANAFGEIFPNPQDLKSQILEIVENIHNRSSDSATRPKFLAVRKYFDSPRCASSSTSPPCGREKCGRCSTVLENFTYSHSQSARLTLSLVQPEYGEYLAVSYCWSQRESFRSTAKSDFMSDLCRNMPVMIEQLDGTVRDSRAPCRILRRAIRHAQDNGLKYIWIDQECIEQHDPLEKAIAIEGMDRMYARAQTVLSLLDLRLPDEHAAVVMKALERPPRSIDFTNGVIQWVYRPNVEELINGADALFHILELVAEDRWFTRAWIRQERLCAESRSGSSELWTMCTPELSTRIPGEMCIDTDMFNMAMPVVLDALDSRDKSLKTRLEAAYQRFRDADAFPFDAVRTKGGKSLNMMQGVSILENKGCLIASDKVALVGNCCGWSGRIHQELLRRPGLSYSACLWALAIMNGDASMFCQDPNCASAERSQRMMWMPTKSTSLTQLVCPKATRDVNMKITKEGLETLGWVWKVGKFVDLNCMTDLLPTSKLTDARDMVVLLKHKTFYWQLLRKLDSMRLHSAANLLWNALKYRGPFGIYGRHLAEVPNISLDQIADPDTGRYTVTYQRLGFKDEEEYMNSTDAIEDDYAFYHRFCPYDDALAGYRHTNCELTNKENYHLLLGDGAVIESFSWIIESIKNTGGISIGYLTHDNEEQIVLTDASSNRPYIFTQFRPVTKHVRGDRTEKRLIEWSPFDIWRADRENHRDAPFSWSAYEQDHSHNKGADGVETAATTTTTNSRSTKTVAVTAMEPCNVLFDVRNIRSQNHTLDWPEEFYRDSWILDPSDRSNVEPSRTSASQELGTDQLWFDELLQRVAGVSIDQVKEEQEESEEEPWEESCEAEEEWDEERREGRVEQREEESTVGEGDATILPARKGLKPKDSGLLRFLKCIGIKRWRDVKERV
ncbi:hypothetical protein ACO22_02194 [Paracoccidioides brasiliensis]|uniref:Heterokaryon incompatibility domain-containing protein n=1 Tax=Paracoccidioides brasiliensis TaxID=121759 RepID=A0A1D2JJC6_PARBR|nr:hypothetical protein ACO22_02194 [Paracoccidioides brasiliensis]